MPAIRLSGTRGLPEELISPGDLIMLGEMYSTVATVGAATLTAAQMTTGSLYRSGSVAAFNDTFDTAANILTTLAGNLPGGAVVVGHSFKMRLYNSTGYIDTITLGAGMIAGLGTIATVGAYAWRDFLFTFQSVQVPVSIQATTTNGSPVVTWVLAAGQISVLQGVSQLAVNIQPGASVTGTGVPASTTVLGVTQGQGGTLGITLSANATASGSTLLTFGPTLKVDSLGAGNL